jgi:putative peptidoglycan lipid II flippase
VITVSLATAMLPLLSRYAADGDLRSIGRSVGSTLRSAYALVVPFAALLALMAVDVAQVIWGYGSAAEDYANFAPSLALFGLGLVMFTAHYLMLRGFYALEQTRRVFWIQCIIAATNIAAAILLSRGATPAETAPRLVLAYACAYAVGAVVSSVMLSRTVGSLEGGRLLRFLVRLVIAVALSCLVAYGVRVGMAELVGSGATWGAVVRLGAVGLVFLVAYVAVARVLRITEISDVMSLVTRRLRRSR